ncbi:MAG: hypothetical protein N2247_01055 [Leptospiraceae bacterium]|jgi:hypothetical protein|nr:hypothetical protein [Leptospiraceae bacterium]
MISIIFKQLLKYKYHFLFLIFIWIVGSIIVYQYRFRFLSFLYQISSKYPEIGSSDPKKAYNDYFLPAIDILNKNNVDLIRMSKLCPVEIQSTIAQDKEYEWDFLKKYNFFFFEPTYITQKSYKYWDDKKEYVLQAIIYFKEATNYALEIPSEITIEKKNILLPYILQQSYDAICYPNDAKIFWKKYIDYIENNIYKNHLLKDQNLPFPQEMDLALLNLLNKNPKYHFAIYQYIGKTIPFYLKEDCPKNLFVCNHLEETNEYMNKLIYTTDLENMDNLFLNHARLYILMYKKKRNQELLHLALDRYKGAMDYRSTQIDAYLEMTYLFLLLDLPENSLKTLQSFREIKPKNFLQEPMYNELIYKTLTSLKRFEEADCFRTKYLDSADCKKIRENF